MAAPEQLTLETAVGAISSFQQRLASLAGDAEAFAASHLPADDGGARAAVLEASQRARQTLVAFSNATAPVVAFIGGRGGIAEGGAGGEGAGAGGGGGGGGARAEAAALRTPRAQQEEFQGDERGDDNEEPPARKRARVAAGAGARAEAATAAAAATATAAAEAEPRAAAVFASLASSSSETFPSPSSSTSSEDDGDDGGESGGVDSGGGEGAGGGGGGEGQDDGFVFASQAVTKYVLSKRTIGFRSHVLRALRLDGGAPDSVQRGTGSAESRKESYGFAVFALRSAPARRGPSSWEPPARDAPGTQAFNTDFSSYTFHSETYGTIIRPKLAGVGRCFRRRGDRGVATAAQEGALRDAEVGDELVFARRGLDRELFVWLEKKAQGCDEGDERGDDNEEPPARKRARVAAGTGAREAAAAAAAAATAAAAAAAARPPQNDAEPRAAALFSSLSSSSSETFPAPSSSTSSEEDDDDGGGESGGGGGDGAGEGAAGGAGGGGGGGQGDGFVFASQPVTRFMLSRRVIQFSSDVVHALLPNGGAPDSVKRGARGAESKKKFYRFAVFALRSAPARRGLSSWEPPARGAPGTQAFNTDFSSYTCHSESGTQCHHTLERVTRCFRRHGDRGVATAEQEGALCDAEVGDEVVFARRGLDRELFLWLVKKAQG